MTDLAGLVSTYGWQAITVAVLLFILLRSDIRVHYPGRDRGKDAE